MHIRKLRGEPEAPVHLHGMKPGVSMSRHRQISQQSRRALAAAHPIDRGIGVALETLSETRAHDLRPMLFLLMGAVSLILLIACVNLANLLLARNSAREQELAMRAALGAGRGRLVAQLLAETLLLSLIGGGVGLVLARIGVASLTRLHPENVPQLGSIGVDWRVLMFTVVVSLITSLSFGLGPALTGARLNPANALKLGSRSPTAGPRAQRMRNVLVVVEMAMSLMLLVGASLLVQSTLRLERQQLGVRQDHLLTGLFICPACAIRIQRAITRFSGQFADRVRALPGVTEASVTTIYPPNYNWTQMLGIPGNPATRIQDIPSAKFGLTDTHFLRTLGIPLIRGRDFAESDTAASPPVALITQGLERKYFHGGKSYRPAYSHWTSPISAHAAWSGYHGLRECHYHWRHRRLPKQRTRFAAGTPDHRFVFSAPVRQLRIQRAS